MTTIDKTNFLSFIPYCNHRKVVLYPPYFTSQMSLTSKLQQKVWEQQFEELKQNLNKTNENLKYLLEQNKNELLEKLDRSNQKEIQLERKIVSLERTIENLEAKIRLLAAFCKIEPTLDSVEDGRRPQLMQPTTVAEASCSTVQQTSWSRQRKDSDASDELLTKSTYTESDDEDIEDSGDTGFATLGGESLTSIDDCALNTPMNSGVFAIRETRPAPNNRLSILFEDVNGKTTFCPDGNRKLNSYKEGDVVLLENFEVIHAELPAKFSHASSDVSLIILDVTSVTKIDSLSPYKDLALDTGPSTTEYIQNKQGYHMIVCYNNQVEETIKKKNVVVTKAIFTTKDFNLVEITIWDKPAAIFRKNKHYVIQYCNVNTTAPKVGRRLYFHTTPTTIFREIQLSGDEPKPRSLPLYINRPRTAERASLPLSQGKKLVKLNDLKSEYYVSDGKEYRIENLQVLQSTSLPDGEVQIAVKDDSNDQKVLLKIRNGLSVEDGDLITLKSCKMTHTKGMITLTAQSEDVEMEILHQPLQHLPNTYMKIIPR